MAGRSGALRDSAAENLLNAGEAVAICADFGAAVCDHHAHVTARWLTRTMVINRVVAIEPPAPSAAAYARPPADAAPTANYAAAG